MGVYISGVDMPKQDEILQIRIYGNGKVSRVYDIKCQQVGTAIETTQVVPIEEVWANVQPLKDKILELEEKLYLQNEKQKVQTINWSHDQISRAEVLALINKAMYNTDNKDIQDYLFCGLRRDVHNLPSADRPNVAYICDGRKCDKDCSECFRTLDIEHARDFKLLGDTYYQQEQVDRPKGEWKWTHGGQCSECGFHNTNFDFNFCPNCGADMRGDVM